MLIFFLTLLLLVALVSVYFLTRIIKIQLDKISVYEDWIRDLKQDVSDAYEDMKSLDDKQIFQKDDEVGVVFQDLVAIMKKLNDRTE